MRTVYSSLAQPARRKDEKNSSAITRQKCCKSCGYRNLGA